MILKGCSYASYIATIEDCIKKTGLCTFSQKMDIIKYNNDKISNSGRNKKFNKSVPFLDVTTRLKI